MKTRTPPDWYSLVFAWAFTAIVFALFATKPGGVHANEQLKFLLLLWAIATTVGFIAMQWLKKKHKKEFEDLGRPRLWGSPLDNRTRSFLGYLFHFQFLRLKDPVISIGFIVYLSLSAICLFWILTFALPQR